MIWRRDLNIDGLNNGAEATRCSGTTDAFSTEEPDTTLISIGVTCVKRE
tara:strand:+ start:203 stop:349 length:147 start_codon:yes stop_codon:yes gene_type:complete